jgi:hypothetical protein
VIKSGHTTHWPSSLACSDAQCCLNLLKQSWSVSCRHILLKSLLASGACDWKGGLLYLLISDNEVSFALRFLITKIMSHISDFVTMFYLVCLNRLLCEIVYGQCSPLRLLAVYFQERSAFTFFKGIGGNNPLCPLSHSGSMCFQLWGHNNGKAITS